MSALRAVTIISGFAVLTLPLMPVQALLNRVNRRAARRFPHWYHRQVCRLLGIRLHVEGKVANDAPVLLIANHTSWLDIPVVSAVAPVSFIAKKEVGGWPGVSALARLQRSVFVDRARRTAVGDTTSELTRRLAQGDTLVLFAEGTSSDGNRVLPFRTSLFAAAKPRPTRGSGDEAGRPSAHGAVVQTMTLVYTHVHGVPLARADRPVVGWYGDMDMLSHAWTVLKSGPIDVTIRIGEPVELSKYVDRKDLARDTESRIRTEFLRITRGRQDVRPDPGASRPESPARPRATTTRKWV